MRQAKNKGNGGKNYKSLAITTIGGNNMESTVRKLSTADKELLQVSKNYIGMDVYISVHDMQSNAPLWIMQGNKMVIIDSVTPTEYIPFNCIDDLFLANEPTYNQRLLAYIQKLTGVNWKYDSSIYIDRLYIECGSYHLAETLEKNLPFKTQIGGDGWTFCIGLKLESLDAIIGEGGLI